MLPAQQANANSVQIAALQRHGSAVQKGESLVSQGVSPFSLLVCVSISCTQKLSLTWTKLELEGLLCMGGCRFYRVLAIDSPFKLGTKNLHAKRIAERQLTDSSFKEALGTHAASSYMLLSSTEAWMESAHDFRKPMLRKHQASNPAN